MLNFDFAHQGKGSDIPMSKPKYCILQKALTTLPTSSCNCFQCGLSDNGSNESDRKGRDARILITINNEFETQDT